MSNKIQVSDEYLEELYLDMYDTPILDLYEELKELELIPDTNFWCYRESHRVFDFKESLFCSDWDKRGKKVTRLKLFYFVKYKNELETVNKLIHEYSFYFKKYFNYDRYSRFSFNSSYDTNHKDHNPFYIEWSSYHYEDSSISKRTYMDTLFSEIGKSYCNDLDFFIDHENRKNKKIHEKTKKVIKNSETKEFVYDYEEVWDLYEKHVEYILSIRKILESIYCKLAFIEYSYTYENNYYTSKNDMLIYRLQILSDGFRTFKGLILDDCLLPLDE